MSGLIESYLRDGALAQRRERCSALMGANRSSERPPCCICVRSRAPVWPVFSQWLGRSKLEDDMMFGCPGASERAAEARTEQVLPAVSTEDLAGARLLALASAACRAVHTCCTQSGFLGNRVEDLSWGLSATGRHILGFFAVHDDSAMTTAPFLPSFSNGAGTRRDHRRPLLHHVPKSAGRTEQV
jgi:hypothetical protein